MTTPDTQDLIKRLEAAYKASMPVGDLWNLCAEAADELERLRAQVASLSDVASGKVKHDNMGQCPDDMEGHDTRDPECPACRALLAAAPAQQAGQAPAPEQPTPEALPHPGSPEASAMIDSVLAEYNWPANAKNAARAGYVAARRLMGWARKPLPDFEAPAVQAGPVRYPHPDEDDAVTLWAEIHRLRAAVQGPDGYASWQEAATAERVRRVAAEKALAAVAAPALWQSRLRIRGQDNNWSEWRDCSEAAAQDCVRCRDEQWEYEVRALAVVAVQQSKPPVQQTGADHD